eukprot:GFYU01004554.1.p1 GENE.GFYU01004554.1~~GFYU01004554.1.p1  ORF type:complete len:339 (-),score=56.17 GFYU01004554.1:886-1902(-)
MNLLRGSSSNWVAPVSRLRRCSLQDLRHVVGMHTPRREYGITTTAADQTRPTYLYDNTTNIHQAARAIADIMKGNGHFTILSGAGVSTASGLPDYRSPGRPPPTPTNHSEFVNSTKVRQRYWARSFKGWHLFYNVRPNDGHKAIAEMEDLGAVTHLITQNVDGLHQRAGSRCVLELHGNNFVTHCLDKECTGHQSRLALQLQMKQKNPDWDVVVNQTAMKPDGDMDLPEDVYSSFKVPSCHVCGTDMKPELVFFGDNVPRDRVEKGKQWTTAGNGLLVVGTTLHVFSGRRYAKLAHNEGKPIVVLNHGPTRVDEMATIKVEHRLQEILPAIVECLKES